MVDTNDTAIELFLKLNDQTEAGLAAAAKRIEEFERRVAALDTRIAGLSKAGALPSGAALPPLPELPKGATREEFEAQNRALLAQVGALQLAAEASQRVAISTTQIETALVGTNAAAARAFNAITLGARESDVAVQKLVEDIRRLGAGSGPAGAAAQARLAGTAGVPVSGPAIGPALASSAASSAFLDEQTRKLRDQAAALQSVKGGASEAQLALAGVGSQAGTLGTTLGSLSLGAVAGFGLVLTAVNAVTNAISDAAAESANIDKALAPIAAQSKAAADSLETVRQNVRDLRAETGRSIGDVAGLAAATAEFGAQADKDLQRVVLRASDAGLGTAQQTLSRLRALAQGFGEELNASNFERIGDEVKAVSDVVGVSAEKVAEATASAAATADDYGVSLGALAVTVANATKRTGDQAQSANQARQALKLLGDETSDLNNIFQANGVEITRAALAGDGFARVAQRIGEVLRAQPELRSELPDRLATFFESQVNALEQTARAAASAAGAINAASDDFQKAPGQQAARASERFDELKNSIVETLVPLNQIKVEIGTLFNDLDKGKAIELPPLLKLLTVPGLFADVLTKFNQLRELAKLEGEDGALSGLGKKLEIPLAPFTFLVDLLGKANEKIKETDANFASRLQEARRVAELGKTGGFDPAERTGEAAGTLFADGFNREVDKRVDFVTLDRGQQRIRDLLTKLSDEQLAVPIALAPFIEPAAITAARAELQKLEAIPTGDLLPGEKQRVQVLTQELGQYQDALKSTSDIAQRSSLTIADGFTRQAQTIESSRASTVRLLEAARRYVPEAQTIIALVNQAAAAETRRVNVQDNAARFQAETGRQQALAAELQAVSKLAALRGDLAQAERDEVEALRLKGEAERRNIEAARVAAVEKAAGVQSSIEDANAEADAKLRTLELDERSAALARERAREQRAATASLQLQAARNEGLRGLEAEIQAIRQRGAEERQQAADRARTNAEETATLAERLERSRRLEDRNVREARRNGELAIEQQILEAQRSAAVSLEEQQRLELRLLAVEQQRARLALERSGEPRSVLEARDEADTAQQRAVRARQAVERVFGAGQGIEVALLPKFELDQALREGGVQEEINQKLAELNTDLALGLDNREALRKIRETSAEIEKLRRAAAGSFGEGILGGLESFANDPNADFNRGLGLARDGIESTRGAFQDLIGDVRKGKADLGDFFASLADGLANSIDKALADYATQQLFGGLLSLIGGGAGGAGGGIPFFLARPSAQGNVFRGGNLVPIQPFARGGIPGLGDLPKLGNQEAIFGMPNGGLGSIRERGISEAIVPLPDGRRIPVDLRTRVEGGGGASRSISISAPVTVHVTHTSSITAEDPAAFDAKLARSNRTVAAIVTQTLERQLSTTLKNEIQRAARG